MALKFKPSLCLFFCLVTNYLSSKPIFVKVLIDECPIEENKSWSLSAAEIELVYPQNKATKKIKNKVKFEIANGQLFIDRKPFIKNLLQIKSTSEFINFENRTYAGSFYIFLKGGIFLLINRVELEDYIRTVLRTESWPGWPLEVNKAFAITCRSYVVSKILENSNTPFHVRCNNKHQVYRGEVRKELSKNARILQQATEETSGIVLGYNNNPILAMFDCCCGGIIPSQINGIDFNKAPYLARDYACNYCKDFKIYSWKREFNKKKFEDLLKKELTELKSLKSISTSTDEAGLVKTITLNDPKNKFEVKGALFYSLFKEIVSFCYSIDFHANKIVINGRGYGHHLGLCQWGAKQMATQGWNYPDILKFYYPGTTLLKLQTKSDTI